MASRWRSVARTAPMRSGSIGRRSAPDTSGRTASSPVRSTSSISGPRSATWSAIPCARGWWTAASTLPGRALGPTAMESTTHCCHRRDRSQPVLLVGWIGSIRRSRSPRSRNCAERRDPGDPSDGPRSSASSRASSRDGSRPGSAGRNPASPNLQVAILRVGENDRSPVSNPESASRCGRTRLGSFLACPFFERFAACPLFGGFVACPRICPRNSGQSRVASTSSK